MIKLIQMRDNEFNHYIERMIFLYGKDIARSREASDKDECLNYAKGQIATLLPKGNKTENNYFYSIYKGDYRIGAVWFSVQGDSLVFLHDISLDKEQRRKGYGSDVLKKIERLAKDLGARSIALHVFYHNKAAQSFYKKNNYATTGLQMFKQLPPA